VFALSGVAWAVVAAVAAAGFFALRRLATRQWAAAAALTPAALTRASVEAVPPRPDFRIVDAGTTPPEPGSGGSDSAEARDFRRALIELHEHFESAPRPQPAPAPLAMAALRSRILEALTPARTVPRRVLARLDIPARHSSAVARPDPLDELRWAPEMREPMYKPLRQISPELLVPNLELIPLNTMALMQTNQPFIEAYMVGVNHEFARELLWREYPCEQRATFFRQFWEVKGLVLRDPRLSPDEQREALYDIKPIHTWPGASDLGQHNNRAGGVGTMLVLTIRSDLLRKYPNTVISAVEAQWTADDTRRELSENEVYPLFQAEVPPDITFFGFNLTKEQVLGSPDPAQRRPGWFFVLKERPGEPRFALDLEDGPPKAAHAWDDLSWANTEAKEGECLTLSKPLKQVFVSAASNPDHVAWGANAADMAYITYQSPVLVAIHADEMIADEPPR
jgi:hypothetical protein